MSDERCLPTVGNVNCPREGSVQSLFFFKMGAQDWGLPFRMFVRDLTATCCGVQAGAIYVSLSLGPR